MPLFPAKRYTGAVAILWQALITLLALIAAPALAQNAPTHIAARLLAEGAAAAGGTVTLAIEMKPAAGWHGYWRNPGDAGFGMQLDWALPKGSSTGALQYPVPETLVVSGLMNHVYQRDYAVLVPLALPAGAVPGSYPISVKANWLACTEQVCVPERATLATTITISAPGAAARPATAFDAWRSKLPAPLSAQVHYAIEGATLRLAIPFPAASAVAGPHLFAADDHVVDYAAPQIFARAGDVLLVTLQRAKVAAVSPASFGAVLRLNAAGDGLALVATPGAVPAGANSI